MLDETPDAEQSEDDPSVKAAMERIEAGDTTPPAECPVSAAAIRLRWVREATRFALKFTPYAATTEEIYCGDEFLDPATARARNAARVAAFALVAREFDAYESNPVAFTLDVTKAGRG